MGKSPFRDDNNAVKHDEIQKEGQILSRVLIEDISLKLGFQINSASTSFEAGITCEIKRENITLKVATVEKNLLI